MRQAISPPSVFGKLASTCQSTWFGLSGRKIQILSLTNHPFQSGHHLTINVTGILTGFTLELELVAVTVIVKVPAGVPCGGGGGGAEPPPQPMQSSTTNAPAPVAKTQRGMCRLYLSQTASRTITSRQMVHSGQ